MPQLWCSARRAPLICLSRESGKQWARCRPFTSHYGVIQFRRSRTLHWNRPSKALQLGVRTPTSRVLTSQDVTQKQGLLILVTGLSAFVCSGSGCISPESSERSQEMESGSGTPRARHKQSELTQMARARKMNKSQTHAL